MEPKLTGYPSIDKPWLKYYSEEAINATLPECTVYEYLEEIISNRNYYNMTALTYYGTRICFRTLLMKIDEVALVLSNYVQAGDMVSLCLPSVPETFYLFFAINKLGAIANMIDPRINVERLRECIGNETKVLFFVETYAESILEACTSLDIKEKVLVSPSDSLSLPYKVAYCIKSGSKNRKECITWKQFLKTSKRLMLPKVKSNPNGPAAIVYTSGTTGIPKGAILSNYGIVSICFQQKLILPDMLAGDSFLEIMPPFIAYGLVCGLCASLTTGLNLILIPRFDPQKFDEILIKYKPNHVMGVPSFFESLLCSDVIGEKDISFIKYAIVGGDKIQLESEKRVNEYFRKHGVRNRVIKGYGMTELSSGAIINYEDALNELGTVGMPLRDMECKVMDTTTYEELPYDEVGELFVTGPSLMKGYKDNKQEEDKVCYLDDEGITWVRTGDLAKISPKGNVTIVGRIKRMIVRPDGHNVFPATIEDVITGHPAVESCVVVGLKCPEYENGRIPTAFIVVKKEYLDKEESVKLELIELSSKKLPPRDVALEYRFIDKIPYTGVGKVDYSLLENVC